MRRTRRWRQEAEAEAEEAACEESQTTERKYNTKGAIVGRYDMTDHELEPKALLSSCTDRAGLFGVTTH